MFDLFRGCYGYWSIVFSVSSSKLALRYGNLMSLSHTLFRCLFSGKYGKGGEIIDELEITKRYTHNCLTSITISSVEYIELVIKLLEKTFEIKVSFIEFFAFYHPLFTFLPARHHWHCRDFYPFIVYTRQCACERRTFQLMLQTMIWKGERKFKSEFDAIGNSFENK